MAAAVISMEHITGKSNPYNPLTKPLGTQNYYLPMKEFLV